MTAPGWYPDPHEHTVERWWDGTVWTGATRERPGQLQQGGGGRWVTVAVLTVLIVATIGALAWTLLRDDDRDYPNSVRDSFLVACTVNSGDDFCRCALESVEEEFTVQEFNRLERQILLTGELPRSLVDVISDSGC